MILADTATLREAMEKYREGFAWLPDRVKGLHADVVGLDAEYARLGKDFMLAERGEYGCYPAESHWLVPKDVDDLWIRKHLAPMVAISDLIPCSETAKAARQMCRAATEVSVNTYFTAGDLGDVIAMLPILRAVSGGSIVIGDHTGPNQGRESMKGTRFDAIKPLLECQPYVHSVSWGEFEHGMTNLSNFRTDHRYGENLISWQARHIGVAVSEEPWLTVERIQHGRPVVSRSLRYPGSFDWKRALQTHGRNALFVGLKEEHEVFQKNFGRIEWRPTRDLLELAQVIAGGTLLIANQSCPFWIGAGLGVPIMQETFHGDPNSIIRRPNCVYSEPSAPERMLMQYRLRPTR